MWYRWRGHVLGRVDLIIGVNDDLGEIIVYRLHWVGLGIGDRNGTRPWWRLLSEQRHMAMGLLYQPLP
jgi:hypothetical protein